MNDKLKKITRVNLKSLIIGLILIISFICCVSLLADSKNNKSVNYLSDVQKEGYAAKIDISEVPYLFYPSLEDENLGYYFVTDNNKYLYIVYMNNETYNNILNSDGENGYVTIYGVSASIKNDVKSIAITALKTINEDFDINEDNFNNYFGLNILDTVSDNSDAKYGNYIPTTSIYIFMTLFLIAGLLSIITFILNVKRDKTLIHSMSSDKINKISKELDSKDCKDYSKRKVYLTKNYVIDFESVLNIIKYSDILWIYMYENKSYGLFVNKRSIMIVDKDFRRYEVANKFKVRREFDKYMDVYDTIVSRSPKALVGYNDENVEKISKMIKK